MKLWHSVETVRQPNLSMAPLDLLQNNVKRLAKILQHISDINSALLDISPEAAAIVVHHYELPTFHTQARTLTSLRCGTVYGMKPRKHSSLEPLDAVNTT